MIKVSYERRGALHELSIQGHAGYSNHGNDIVCAGMSAITYSLLGYLDKYPEYISGKWNPMDVVTSGNVKVCCTGNDNIRTAFEMAMTGYELIAAKYPDNVRITIAATGG